MKIVVVSTYPRAGSQNVGDKLIENASIRAIHHVAPEAEVTVIWRAESWNNVKAAVSVADHVLFACLAIRNDMASTYPFLANVLDTGRPVSALSAGTSLKPHLDAFYSTGFSDTDIDLLRRFDQSATAFSTRGLLTQAFCRHHGLLNATFSGDVAFFDPRFDRRVFREMRAIDRIVISDPHYAQDYAAAFRSLVRGLRDLFPNARLDCALHGKTPLTEALAREMEIGVRPIYTTPEDGTGAYDDYDLHVGFRVHGHVSALQRRIPSYLLEQDGRGADYGLTLNVNSTVPCYRHFADDRRLFRKKATYAVHGSAIDMMMAMIAADADDGFRKFVGMERQIASFNEACMTAVQSICGTNEP